MPNPPPTTPHRTASGSVDPAYFEALYETEADPWDYGSSAYEAAKYAHTLAALPRERYRHALEIGCSIGILTERLAAQCERLLAIDVAPGALAQARARCDGLPHVQIQRATVPDQTPPGSFDLVVMSEVGYYLAPVDLARLRRQLARRMETGGHLVLVHWRGETDYPLHADDVHRAFLEDEAWSVLADEAREAYRLGVLERS